MAQGAGGAERADPRAGTPLPPFLFPPCSHTLQTPIFPPLFSDTFFFSPQLMIYCLFVLIT